VFLKTETDEKMLTAYDNFNAGIIEMKKATSIEEFCTSEQTRPHYLWIRKYLSVHELIAVGIRENVLDSNVCYSYWADTLTNGYGDASPVLDFVRNRPRNKYTYSDLAGAQCRVAHAKEEGLPHTDPPTIWHCHQAASRLLPLARGRSGQCCRSRHCVRTVRRR
jgi:hypothetical protein